MRHATLLLAAASALLMADAACAQSQPAGQASGLRYLSWNDRPQPQPQPVSAPVAGPRADGMRRPNMVIPHGGFSQVEEQRLTPAPGARYGGGLTPANAWLNGRGAMPAAQPQPQPTRQPSAPAPAPTQPREEIAYAAPAPSQIEAPRELTPPNYPDYLPSRGYRQYTPGDVAVPVQPTGAPTYHNEDDRPAQPQPTSPQPQRPSAATPQAMPQAMPQALPTPAPRNPEPQGQPAQMQPTADAGFDPMAPRRDAPIFRIQSQNQAAQAQAQAAQAAQASQAAPQATPNSPRADARDDANAPRRVAMVTSNTADRPGRDQGARYYSVHRQNGQQPDAIAMPEPTYVDALAVNMTETPASQDLAAPDAGPTLIRDNQGRLRAAPAASNGDHQ